MRNSQELWRPGKTLCGFVELLISGCKVLYHTDGLNDALVLCHAQRKRCMLWEAGVLVVTERFTRSKANLSHNYRQIISGSKTKPFHPHPH